MTQEAEPRPLKLADLFGLRAAEKELRGALRGEGELCSWWWLSCVPEEGVGGVSNPLITEHQQLE